MIKKKVYTSPVCSVSEIAPQRILDGSTRIGVDSSVPLNNMGGDVNRNEDYDIWNN